MNKKSFFTSAPLILMVFSIPLLLTGCGATLHGFSHNSVPVTLIIPDGSTALLNGKDTLQLQYQKGLGSVGSVSYAEYTAYLPRGVAGQTLEIKNESGSKTVNLEKSMSGLILASDLLFTLGVGLVVDFATGNWYDYEDVGKAE